MAISANLPWRREPMTYARNGKIPTATWRRSMIDAANHVMKYQRRELFSSPGSLTIPAAGGTGGRARWRFRAPTGYGARAFMLQGLMAQTPTTGTGPAYTQVTATPVGGGTTITTPIYYGNIASGTPDDSLDELGEFQIVTAACADNTVYEFEVFDFQNARIAQLDVYELADFEPIPPTTGVYIAPNYAAVGAPILDNQRGRLLEMLSQMWDRNAAVLFQFAANLDDSSAPELASSTATNILDETSTAVAATTPGCWEGDLAYKRSLANAFVKAEFVVYARTTSGAGGSVTLKHSGGTIATISGITTGGAWYSTSADIPATVTKLDVHMATTTGTIRVLSAGCYLYV